MFQVRCRWANKVNIWRLKILRGVYLFFHRGQIIYYCYDKRKEDDQGCIQGGLGVWPPPTPLYTVMCLKSQENADLKNRRKEIELKISNMFGQPNPPFSPYSWIRYWRRLPWCKKKVLIVYIYSYKKCFWTLPNIYLRYIRLHLLIEYSYHFQAISVPACWKTLNHENGDTKL